MAAKPLRAGSEVDAWCTKCRMDLLHRIIAMQGPKIERVECRTCGGHHNYRAPKSAAAAAATSSRSSDGAPRSARERPPGVRATAAAEAERSRTAAWEKKVLGQPLTAFKAYRPAESFALGDRIKHVKFGDGYIIRVIDRQKVEV